MLACILLVYKQREIKKQMTSYHVTKAGANVSFHVVVTIPASAQVGCQVVQGYVRSLPSLPLPDVDKQNKGDSNMAQQVR